MRTPAVPLVVSALAPASASLCVNIVATAVLVGALAGCKRAPDTVPPRAASAGTSDDVSPSGPIEADMTEAPTEVRNIINARAGFPRASAFDDETSTEDSMRLAADQSALPDDAGVPPPRTATPMTRNIGEGERETVAPVPAADPDPDIPLPLDAGTLDVDAGPAEPAPGAGAAERAATRADLRRELDVRLNPAQSTDPDEIAVSEQLSLAITEGTDLSSAARDGVTVTTLNGVVTLTGEVPTSRDRDAIVALVEDLVGDDFAIANLIGVREP